MKRLQHPDYLALRSGAEVIEVDGLGDKVLCLPDGTFVKLFRRKRLLSSAAWSPYAQRFADNAAALARLGIPCPQIIEVWRITSVARDAVHYHPLPGLTLRALIAGGLTPEREQWLKQAFTAFVRHLHDLGIYFRSLHLGNVVLTPDDALGLIDISDVRLHRRPLSRFWRERNLRRMQDMDGERDWLDRERLLATDGAPK